MTEEFKIRPNIDDIIKEQVVHFLKYNTLTHKYVTDISQPVRTFLICTKLNGVVPIL